MMTESVFVFCPFQRWNNVWVAELENDLMTLKKETMHPCIHVSQSWEEVWPRVNEGPFVIKHNGVYYMTYSANSYESPFYGVGCATATHIMGDWHKYLDNPLLQNPDGLQGVGHSAIFAIKRKISELFFMRITVHRVFILVKCISVASVSAN